MLARSFLTAAELKLTDAERDALIKVLHMLERGELAYHEAALTVDGNVRRRLPPIGFNMAAFYAKADCGTIHCIAGWAEIVGHLEPYQLAAQRMNFNRNLYDLFEAPDVPAKVIKDITPAQAAHALSNYLTTGEPRWAEALSA